MFTFSIILILKGKSDLKKNSLKDEPAQGY